MTPRQTLVFCNTTQSCQPRALSMTCCMDEKDKKDKALGVRCFCLFGRFFCFFILYFPFLSFLVPFLGDFLCDPDIPGIRGIRMESNMRSIWHQLREKFPESAESLSSVGKKGREAPRISRWFFGASFCNRFDRSFGFVGCDS